MSDLVYAVRGSFGFALKRGVEAPKDLVQETLDPRNVHCRCLTFSNSGAYLAYCDSTRTVVVDTATGSERFAAADLCKTACILFSPRDRYMVTYEPYVIYGIKSNPDGTQKVPSPNLRIFEVATGKLLTTLIADKQISWKPYFTEDESVALRVHGSEVLFFKNGNFEKHAHKTVIKNVHHLSVSPGKTPYVCCFIPSKNEPALIQLRALNDKLDVLYSKASFNCDRCVMNWNSKGTAVLVTASVDVDKSNQSYYGVSHIYCISTKAECYQVPLSKEGPVHSLDWAPNGTEFCVCYGFMPSKVTTFNVKGDVLWDLGTAHRNEVHYNAQSTILATCGFGNIASGKMEFWDLAEQKAISQFSVPHTTHFAWAPDGQHLCTSTTAPRLRTDNNYRIWNYRGRMINEHFCSKEELWEVKWCPSTACSAAAFAIEEPSTEQKSANAGRITANNSEGIVLPKGAIAQGRYVPPQMRGKNNVKGGGGTDGAASTSKSSAGHKGASGSEEMDSSEKRMRALKKKLDDIEKLKGRQAEGQQLELNQLDKIKSEPELRKEFERLELGAANAK